MPLKPLDLYILVKFALREREIDRILVAQHQQRMAEWGLLNPDGTLNVAAIMADTVPLDWSEYDGEMYLGTEG